MDDYKKCLCNAEILILGIGNILLRDEGIGVRVIEALKKLQLPENVELVDGGTAGADLLDIISNRSRVIIIDAIEGDYSTGSIVCFGNEDIEKLQGYGINSLHNINIMETLAMARLLGSHTENIVIVGIKPDSIDCGTELSEKIKSIVPDVIEVVLSMAKVH